MRRFVVVIAAAAAAMAFALSNGGGPVDDGTANLLVATSSCTATPTREATPFIVDSAPSTAVACTFDQAWDAANPGDTIRVQAGTYAEQLVNGDKASDTFIIGAGDGDDVLVGNGSDGADCGSANWSALCANAAHLVVQNLTTVVDDPGPFGGLSVNAPNVTVRDFHTRGASWGDGNWKPSSIGVSATGFLFDGGSVGRTDTTEQARCSHSAIEPLWFQSGGDNATMKNVQVGRYEPKTEPPGPDIWQFCSPEADGSYTPHIETIRFEDSDGITFSGVTFNGPSDAGSGHVFSSADPDDITFINSVFEERGTANAWAQFNGATPNNWMFLYSTLLDDGGISGTITGMTLAGNLGFSPGCATNVKNVWSGSGACGSDVFVGATSLGIGSDNKLQAGSPAIDAAETPGASDYCTDPTLVGSRDFEGNTRPFGSVCDAGADEYEG